MSVLKIYRMIGNTKMILVLSFLFIVISWLPKTMAKTMLKKTQSHLINTKSAYCPFNHKGSLVKLTQFESDVEICIMLL